MHGSGSESQSRPWADLAEKPDAPVLDLGGGVLDVLGEQLAMETDWVDREGRTLTWWGAPLPMSISVSEPRLALGDPTVKVTMTVQILRDIGADLEDGCLVVSAVNGMNVGGMVWIDPNSLSLNSTITHYAHPGNVSVLDRGILAMLATLNYSSALGKAPHFEGMFGVEAVARPHPTSGFRSDNSDSVSYAEMIPSLSATMNHWKSIGLSESLHNFRSKGLLATGDNRTVTTEFPYSSATPAVMQAATGAVGMEGLTSLYTQDLTQPHPEMGEGMLCLLRLPESSEMRAAAVLANGLNWAEANEMTGFPAWGAWTTFEDIEQGTLAHAFFSPGLGGEPGLAKTIGFYAFLRSQWAQERLLSEATVEQVRTESDSEG